MKIYDYSLNNKCLDCNKSISNRAKKCLSCSAKRRVFTLEHKQRISDSKKGKNYGRFGKNHYRWISGVPQNYKCIHKRINKMYGKLNFCENCKCRETNKKYEWSNKDHKYDSLDRSKWQFLCQLCHLKYDRVHNENI